MKEALSQNRSTRWKGVHDPAPGWTGVFVAENGWPAWLVNLEEDGDWLYATRLDPKQIFLGCNFPDRRAFFMKARKKWYEDNLMRNGKLRPDAVSKFWDLLARSADGPEPLVLQFAAFEGEGFGTGAAEGQMKTLAQRLAESYEHWHRSAPHSDQLPASVRCETAPMDRTAQTAPTALAKRSSCWMRHNHGACSTAFNGPRC